MVADVIAALLTQCFSRSVTQFAVFLLNVLSYDVIRPRPLKTSGVSPVGVQWPSRKILWYRTTFLC